MTEIDHAAAEVADHLPRGDGVRAVPWAVLVPLISALVQSLMGCFPTPVGGQAFLREPPFGLMGFRQQMWRRRINAAVAKHWKGDPASLPDVQRAVLGRIRAGVAVTTVGRLYVARGG